MNNNNPYNRLPEGFNQQEHLTPNEQVTQHLCRELLGEDPNYQGTFCFGTPGGNDLDLRLCFADLSTVQEDAVRARLTKELHTRGIDVEVDLLFMSGRELESGRIRDLTELGDISERLVDGFDPHEQQAAVGDTSLFSLYIFSTMRELDRSPHADDFGSPESALSHLELTRDGAIGWMHFYTGTFLHDYLRQRQTPVDQSRYGERVAKYFSRVVMGSVLAQLEPRQLSAIKPQLIEAIQSADASNSTDAMITRVLLGNPDTRALLNPEAQELLVAAGDIRSGIRNIQELPPSFLGIAEARLFYEAFQQGVDRRQDTGEATDSLTSYALGELIHSIGRSKEYEAGEQLMVQGDRGDTVYYIPVKTASGKPNTGVDIVVHGRDGVAHRYVRSAGQVVGEGAVFGLPRSATASAQGHIETHELNVDILKRLCADPVVYRELRQPLISSAEAKRMDVLLRYFARQAGIYTRQTLAYTNRIDEAGAQKNLGDNPLAQYNLGQRFHDTLELFAEQPTAEAPDPPVHPLVTETGQRQLLFETNQLSDKIYAVTGGSVQIDLQNGETITLGPGEFFGEASILGLPTSGAATLSENSQVLAVSAPWFKRFTQSRQPIRRSGGDEALTDVLPVHLLYHLAAKGYDRVRGRLAAEH